MRIKGVEEKDSINGDISICLGRYGCSFVLYLAWVDSDKKSPINGYGLFTEKCVSDGDGWAGR